MASGASVLLALAVAGAGAVCAAAAILVLAVGLGLYPPVRARGVQRLERTVLVVSIDRLIPVLRSAAGGVGRPADELGMRGLFGQRERFE